VDSAVNAEKKTASTPFDTTGYHDWCVQGIVPGARRIIPIRRGRQTTNRKPIEKRFSI